MQRYRLQLSFPGKGNVIWTCYYNTSEEYEVDLAKHKESLSQKDLMTHGTYRNAALISEFLHDDSGWVVADVWAPNGVSDDMTF